MINVNLIRTGGFTNVMLKSYKDYPEIRGELKERVLLNAARLCSPIYRASAIYTQDKNGWPGDWEGRTLLALVSHMKCTGIEPPYLSSVLESIPDHLNSRGYLGGISEEGLFDEQQLSGHNWLIRGLMEYYLLTGDKEISNLVNKIVENLYIPLKGYYLDYPIDPEVRKEQGSFSGTLSGKSGHFILSTDIGCAFMCLDGLSQYYDIFRNPDVYELLDEMVSVFEKIDFVGSHMQTHATLSAVRGIIRLYKATFDDVEATADCLYVGEMSFDPKHWYRMQHHFPIIDEDNYDRFAALVIVPKVIANNTLVGDNVNGGSQALTLDVGHIIIYFLLGVIASASMVVPGISGSMMLKIFGYYEPIVTQTLGGTFKDAIPSGNWNLVLHNVGVLLPFAVGIVVGIFGVAKLIEFLLKKWKVPTYCGILGMVVASPVVILMDSSIYDGFNWGICVAAVIALIAGVVIALKLGADPEPAKE